MPANRFAPCSCLPPLRSCVRSPARLQPRPHRRSPAPSKTHRGASSPARPSRSSARRAARRSRPSPAVPATSSSRTCRPTPTPSGSRWTGSRRESGSNLLNGCWDHTTDMAIARNIRLGGSRQVQFRVDLFNVFNSVVINARSTTLTYNSPATSSTITNNQFTADGSLNPSRLTPATAGGGAATGAQPMRTVQMQIRFMF